MREVGTMITASEHVTPLPKRTPPFKTFVDTQNAARGFVHLQDPSLFDRIYLHQAEADFLLSDLQRGDVVWVHQIADTPKGLRAFGATFGGRPEAEEMTGTITASQSSRGFCHARSDSGLSVFIHVKGFLDYANGTSPSFFRLVPGTRIRMVVRDAYPCANGTRIEVISEGEK